VANFVAEAVTSQLGDEWTAMTFPLHRPLLPLLGKEPADAQGVRPVACIARAGDSPAGLALAQMPTAAEPAAEILSIFVARDLRGQGIATALVKDLEATLSDRGVSRVVGVYMTSRPSLPALERVFAKRGFTDPVRRTIVVRSTPEEASKTLWYRRAKMPSNSTVFPWTELTEAERQTLQRTQAETQWIHPDLEPWRFDQGFDPQSSVGMRRDGEVVGWVINHRIAPDMVRFTVSFIRTDLARRGGIFPLYVASLERLRGTGVTCTFVTASHFESMVKFVLRRCAPFVHFVGETRGVSKDLQPRTGPSEGA
jgi:GNAT superfamily N-acetyltransferase